MLSVPFHARGGLTFPFSLLFGSHLVSPLICFMRQRQMGKPLSTWLIKINFCPASKLGAQFSSLISVEDMSELADAALRPPVGLALRPLTSNHSRREDGWAMMSSWLCHISRDRVRPRGVALAGCWLTERGLRGELGVGIGGGREMSRSGRWRRQEEKKKRRWTLRCTRLSSSWPAAKRSRCYMLIWWLGRSGELFIKSAHGQMWF